jgi:uncharacterized protein YlxW (UPF0749 family)
VIINDIKAQVKEMSSELNKKVSSLKQVESMKKMLQDKNVEIKDLREKLEKYEKGNS